MYKNDHSWADISANTNISKILNLVFSVIIKNMVYFVPYLFFKNLKNQEL